MPPARRCRVLGVVAVAVGFRRTRRRLGREPPVGVQEPVGRRRGRRPVVELAPAAVALHVQRHRLLREEVGHVAQIGVEPVERRIGHATLAAATEMTARADAQVHRCGRVAQDRVVGEHAGERVVVPAVDQQDRDLPVGEHLAEVDRGPERVARRTVRELVVVERQVLAGEVADDVAEGEVVETGAQFGHAPLDRFGRDVVDDVAARGLVEVHRAEVPRDDHLERERVARVPRELPHRRRERDDHRLQVRRARRCQRPLREAHVARAVAAEPAVEPGLLRDPVGRGAAVGGLGEVAVRSTRTVGAAARLDQVAVPARRELGAHRRRDRLASVRRAFEQRGRVVDAHRVVHVGEEDDAVGHLHLHVAFDFDFVAASAHGRECCPPARAPSSGPPLPSRTMDLGLAGANVVVAGGTKGMGLAAAECFAEDGANVAVLARRQGPLDEALESLQALGSPDPTRHPHRPEQRRVDRGGVRHHRRTLGWHRQLAGERGRARAARGTSSRSPTTEWFEAIEIGTLSAVRCVRSCLPMIRAAEWGRIVNVSAHSTKRQTAGLIAYTAAKAALTSISKNLSLHLAPEEILVNTVSPGTFLSEGLLSVHRVAAARAQRRPHQPLRRDAGHLRGLRPPGADAAGG